jgi:hypothetical protein
MIASGRPWRALRLCVSNLSHAKAQSPQSGKKLLLVFGCGRVALF